MNIIGGTTSQSTSSMHHHVQQLNLCETETGGGGFQLDRGDLIYHKYLTKSSMEKYEFSSFLTNSSRTVAVRPHPLHGKSLMKAE